MKARQTAAHQDNDVSSGPPTFVPPASPPSRLGRRLGEITMDVLRLWSKMTPAERQEDRELWKAGKELKNYLRMKAVEYRMKAVEDTCRKEREVTQDWTNKMILVGKNSRYYEELKGIEHKVLKDLGTRVRITHGYKYTLLKKDVKLLRVSENVCAMMRKRRWKEKLYRMRHNRRLRPEQLQAKQAEGLTEAQVAPGPARARGAKQRANRMSVPEVIKAPKSRKVSPSQEISAIDKAVSAQA